MVLWEKKTFYLNFFQENIFNFKRNLNFRINIFSENRLKICIKIIVKTQLQFLILKSFNYNYTI